MELIPILSLIILVATVSTFILAVGAYVLYKIRERKGVETAAQPSSIPAELLAPTPMLAEQPMTQTASRMNYSKSPMQEPIYAPAQENAPQLRPTFVGQRNQRMTFTEASQYQKPDARTFEGERYSQPQRFTRYTGEINRESVKQKEEKEVLRWR
jgi:hypothetical protein